ncbi:hypothetical protein H9P43_000355 [Blastocladiella emersonii ATCC 22665]|nr:hypothetical protein H9P43_000355 [Blastocladiella emersonii ATCC 22665]
MNVDTFLTRRRCGARTALRAVDHDAILQVIAGRRSALERTTEKIERVSTTAVEQRKNADTHAHQEVWRAYWRRLEKKRVALEHDVINTMGSICTSPDFPVEAAEDMLELLEATKRSRRETAAARAALADHLSRIQSLRQHGKLKPADLVAAKSLILAGLGGGMSDTLEDPMDVVHPIAIDDAAAAASYLVTHDGITQDIRDVPLAAPWRPHLLAELERLAAAERDEMLRLLHDTSSPTSALPPVARMCAAKLADEYAHVACHRHSMLRARLALECPGLPTDQLLDSAAAARRRAAALRTAVPAFAATHQSRVASALAALRDHAAAVAAAERSTAALADAVAAAEGAHAVIREWRARVLADSEARAAEDAAKRAADAKRHERELARRDRERAEIMREGETRRTAAAAVRAQEEAKVRALAEVAARERREAMEVAKVRVAERNAAMDEARARARRERETAERDAEAALAERLERLRDVVRERISVERDPARVEQLTKARKAAILNEPPVHGVPGGPTVHGYNETAVFRDPRARLMELLPASSGSGSGGGLARSTQQYVAQMMRDLRPARGFAPEWQSQIKFADDRDQG